MAACVNLEISHCVVGNLNGMHWVKQVHVQSAIKNGQKLISKGLIDQARPKHTSLGMSFP